MLALPLLLGQSEPSREPRLVPEVSNNQIEIRYSFSGEQLLLYGAIVYPDGQPPQPGTDIAIVIKGPLEPIVLREKQQVMGIWMNVGSTRFRSAPSTEMKTRACRRSAEVSTPVIVTKPIRGSLSCPTASDRT
jgi:hypothetical protein